MTVLLKFLWSTENDYDKMKKIEEIHGYTYLILS